MKTKTMYELLVEQTQSENELILKCLEAIINSDFTGTVSLCKHKSVTKYGTVIKSHIWMNNPENLPEAQSYDIYIDTCYDWDSGKTTDVLAVELEKYYTNPNMTFSNSYNILYKQSELNKMVQDHLAFN